MLLLWGAGLATDVLRGGEARTKAAGRAVEMGRPPPALSATSDGIEEALHQLGKLTRLLVGLVGFLVFDNARFAATACSLGELPAAGSLAGANSHLDWPPWSASSLTGFRLLAALAGSSSGSW